MLTTHTQTITIQSLKELQVFASALASYLHPGSIVALNGGLGAGKTTLTQAIGKALGVTETIASPTFVLIHEYNTGKTPIIHLDFYRLGEENSDSLLDEVIPLIEEGQSIVIAEWTSYAPFFADYASIDIQINVDEDNQRHITLNSIQPLTLPKSLLSEGPL